MHAKTHKQSELEHDHSSDAIRERLAGDRRPSYLRDWVYGGMDGAVTTFAIVAGVVGAELSARVILILGMANLLADGFSMAAGNYSGTKTESDEREHLREVERRHIRLAPEGEREEIRQIFAAKGLEGDVLEKAVEAITADEDRWVTTMLSDEYGIAHQVREPWKAALSTFLAFLVCGAVPLLPFILNLPGAFTWSIAMTGVVFFAIGSAKSRWSLQPWWLSALETLGIGAAAAFVAYLVGDLLKSIA
ncbi:MAG: VIT1/CCC1 transporter family protein [Hyphomicrobiaceae bacterium]